MNTEQITVEIPNDETIAALAELDNGGGEWFDGSTEDYIAKLLENWDPDFTKVTPEEARRIAHAEESGFVSESEIDWDSIGTES